MCIVTFALAVDFLFSETAVRADEPPDAQAGITSSELALRAPFAIPRASFFYAALDVPRFEGAILLPQRGGVIRLSHSRALSKESNKQSGIKNSFEGIFHELAVLDAAHGLTRHIEVGGRVRLDGWDEHKDTFYLFDDEGTPIVRDEYLPIYQIGASKRHVNVSDVALRTKLGILQRESESGAQALSLLLSIKLPVGRPRDLTNAGTREVNATFLGSAEFGRAMLHANLGVGKPLGSQNLFIREADIELDTFVHGAVGMNWALKENLSLGVQLEANTSAFKDVDFLDGDPITLFVGLRKRFGRYLVEGGAGSGLDHSKSYRYLAHLALSWTY